MSYEKQTFIDWEFDGEGNVIKVGTTLKAGHLQHIEEGIVANEKALEAIKSDMTPVRGVDYWTDADQEDIVQQVIAALGTPVFGRVDAENNIILTGELVNGTYTVKYEDADGNVSEIGTLNHANIVPGETYTNILTVYPYSLNQRFSASSNGPKACDGMLQMYVPWADVWNKTIRIRGLAYMAKTADNNSATWFAVDSNYSNRAAISGDNMWGTEKASYDTATGVYTVPIDASAFDVSSADYLSMNLVVSSSGVITESDLANIIITIDEEIPE